MEREPTQTHKPIINRLLKRVADYEQPNVTPHLQFLARIIRFIEMYQPDYLNWLTDRISEEDDDWDNFRFIHKTLLPTLLHQVKDPKAQEVLQAIRNDIDAERDKAGQNDTTYN